jgi:transcription elongation factor Elf1
MTSAAMFTCTECGHRFKSRIMPWDGEGDEDGDQQLEAECPSCGQWQDCEVER